MGTNMTYEELVPRPQVAKEIGVSHRTICRWENEKRPGFDRAVKIGRSVFHPRTRIEAAKTLGNRLAEEPAE
jgi:predicted DNA-binding transcriptional regulator AlpA